MSKFGELIDSELPILLDFYTDWNEWEPANKIIGFPIFSILWHSIFYALFNHYGFLVSEIIIYCLLIFIICIVSMVIHHGYEKLENIPNFANAFVKPLGLPFPEFFSYVAAYSEIVGSWLLITGLFTRIGALFIVGTISFAIYHAIVTSGFNIYQLELLVLYFGGSFGVLCTGGGEFAIDRFIKFKRAHIPFL